MPSQKKLLILSCSTGTGHTRAAEALRLTCATVRPDIEVLHLDMAPYLGWFTRTTVVTSYNLIFTYIPKVYKLIYSVSDSWVIQKFFKLLAPIISFGDRRLLKKINQYRPNYIISTHYLAQIILPDNFYCPIDTVITDYYPHKTWLCPNVRNFFVPTEEVKASLEKLHTQVIASGIPIDPEFLKEKDKALLKEKLGIHNSWPVVLIMPMGAEKIAVKQIVEHIYQENKGNEINIAVISDKKTDLPSYKNLLSLEKVENIDEWMRIADVIITKAGGLTITEALQLQKPMIIINSIPGQEDYNAEYLEKNHFGVTANSASDVAKNLFEILDNKINLNKNLTRMRVRLFWKKV